MRHRTSQGNEVGVLVLGSGPAGVVLSPQSDGDICQWLPYARELARRYREALFDWQVPAREVPLVATRTLRSQGARRVVLAGASMGGAYALADAHGVRPRLAGVVSFSGETTLRGGFDAAPASPPGTGRCSFSAARTTRSSTAPTPARWPAGTPARRLSSCSRDGLTASTC